MTAHYTRCNLAASPNLRPVAFCVGGYQSILPGMERKFGNYIREWRRKAGYSQKELAARMAEIAGDVAPDDPDLRIPTTEASLSRIENGKQNFNMATLQALAKVLDVDEPGWLLSRNPFKGAEIISLWDRLDSSDQAKARSVLEAMFGTAS